MPLLRYTTSLYNILQLLVHLQVAMEQQSILHFLEDKSILITGATGFLAKILIEKIMRVQPNVKKLYLLLRAADSSSASQRFNTEVMEKELFKVVKEKYGAKLNSIIQEKVSVLHGDITLDSLGLEYSILEHLFSHVEFVINLAATTKFDERYDIAMGINTIGVANVLSFSKKCRKLRLLLHVSTAYVSGEKEGLIMETPLKLNGTPGLNLEVEKKIVEENLKQTHITSSLMKDLGLQRARKYGWPNTYTFTKAMGEMVLEESKGNIPLVIIRPTIVTSTFREPFPGWIEGIRTVDAFIVGYGTAKLTCLPGDPQTIVDLIPADMVVNAMMATMAAHVDSSTHVICHVGSSKSNPVPYHRLRANVMRFFGEQPWTAKDGKPVVVGRATQLGTRVLVRRYVALCYSLPLAILGVVNASSFGYFNETYLDLSRKVKFLKRLIELYTPYVFFNGVYDDTNIEKLRSVENEIFYFNPKIIDWDNYCNAHIAGVIKYAFKR